MFIKGMSRVKRLDSVVSVIYSLSTHTIYHTPIMVPRRRFWHVEIREHEILVRNTDLPEHYPEDEKRPQEWNKVLVQLDNFSLPLK